MDSQHEEIDHSKEIGYLKAGLKAQQEEVHSIKGTLEKFFDKFDAFVAESRPRQVGLPAIMGMVAAGLSSLVVVFACILYIVNSQVAPITSGVTQLSSVVQSVNTAILKTSNDVQLANKEITVVSNRAKANEETLQWLLFTENIPKQITVLQEQIAQLQKARNEK